MRNIFLSGPERIQTCHRKKCLAPSKCTAILNVDMTLTSNLCRRHGSWNYLGFQGNEWKENVISQIPHFYSYSLAWGIAFSALYPMFNVICREMFPKFYAKVPEDKKAEVVSYLVCLVHHSLVVPAGLYYLYQDFTRDEKALRSVNYAAEYAWFVPYIFGYFLADTMSYAVPQALEGNYEFLYHHILGLGLILTVVYIESAVILKLCPHMLVCELSSYLFTLAYLLRLNGYRGTSIVMALELSFALSFFLTRNLNLSLILFSVWEEMSSSYKAACIFFVLVILLQFYWLYKIIKSQLRKKQKSSKKVE